MRESNRIQRFARLGALRLLLRRRVEVVCLCILLRGRQMKSRVGKEEERDKRNFRLGNKAGRASISTILNPSINCHWQVNSYLIDCWVPSLVTNVRSLASNLHAYTCRRRKRGHVNLLVFVATSLYTNWQETQTKLTSLTCLKCECRMLEKLFFFTLQTRGSLKHVIGLKSHLHWLAEHLKLWMEAFPFARIFVPCEMWYAFGRETSYTSRAGTKKFPNTLVWVTHPHHPLWACQIPIIHKWGIPMGHVMAHLWFISWFTTLYIHC